MEPVFLIKKTEILLYSPPTQSASSTPGLTRARATYKVTCLLLRVTALHVVTRSEMVIQESDTLTKLE